MQPVCVWFSLFVLGSCCLCLGHVVWLAVVSVATNREWWFCLNGCLGEGTNAQIYVRTDVLAQIAVVRAAVYVNQGFCWKWVHASVWQVTFLHCVTDEWLPSLFLISWNSICFLLFLDVPIKFKLLMFWSIMSIAEWWTMPEQQVQNQNKPLRWPPAQFRPVILNTVSSELKCIHAVYSMYSCISSWNYIFVHNLIILNADWRIKTCSLYPTENHFFSFILQKPCFLGLRPWNHKSEVVDKGTASLNRTAVSQWRVSPSHKK